MFGASGPAVEGFAEVSEEREGAVVGFAGGSGDPDEVGFEGESGDDVHMGVVADEVEDDVFGVEAEGVVHVFVAVEEAEVEEAA